MTKFWSALTAALVAALLAGSAPVVVSGAQKDDKADDKKDKEKPIYPAAILSFEERGAAAKDLAPKVADLLFAKLAVRPEFYLVDRADLKKVLDEQQLSLTG